MAKILGFTGYVGNAEALMSYATRAESYTKPITVNRKANHRAKQVALLCCYRSPLKKYTLTSSAHCGFFISWLPLI